jgi:monoamine oxidase
MPRELSGRRVAIVGAGLAGLVAAREVNRHGAEAIVFEPRDRVGGRVWTLRDFGGGRHAEAGADLIESDQESVLDLARQLGCEPVRILRAGFGFHAAGDARFRRGMSGWDRIAKRLQRDVDAYFVSEQRWDTAIARSFARRSVAQWMHEVRASGDERRLLTGMRGFFLADPDELSLLMLVDQVAAWGNPAEAQMWRLRGGNDELPRRLASKIRGSIRLKTAVLSIETMRSGVRVKVAKVADERSRSRRSEVRADYAVVTAPASTLRDVSFNPPLPGRQREAIERLAYGRATRVLAEFKRRFWRGPLTPLAFGTDADTGAVWDGNEQQPGPGGILSFLAGGSASEGLQRLVSQGGRALTRELAWLGSERQAPRAVRMVVWEADPWARGGYAFFRAGYDPELRSWLSRPHGRIVFAGEHTSIRGQGYMSGAVESGRRAAEEIVRMPIA